MEVIVTKRFEKDVDKELTASQRAELGQVIEKIQNAKALNDVPNLKKLSGHKSAYRIKMGDYRIGFLYEENVVKLSRAMNRKEIYRYFP